MARKVDVVDGRLDVSVSEVRVWFFGEVWEEEEEDKGCVLWWLS